MTATYPPQATEPSWAATAELSAAGWTQGAAGSGPDDDLLTLIFQPEQIPIPARVRVRAGRSMPIDTWLDAGYDVSFYDGSALGPGIQCVAEQEVTEAGSRIICIAAQYVFVAGEESVVVAVDPTFLEVYTLMFTGLHQLIGTLQVRRASGSEFRAQPVPGYTTETADTWAELGTARDEGDHR